MSDICTYFKWLDIGKQEIGDRIPPKIFRAYVDSMFHIAKKLWWIQYIIHKGFIDKDPNIISAEVFGPGKMSNVIYIKLIYV